ALATAPLSLPTDGTIPRRMLRRRASEAAVVAWSGTRSPLALVIAFLIPETTQSGAPFPARDLIVILTAFLTLGSYTIQGLTLAPLIRALGLVDADAARREERLARVTVAQSGLAQLDSYQGDDPALGGMVQQLRVECEQRLQQASAPEPTPSSEGRDDTALQELAQLRRAGLDARRRALIELHDRALVGDAIFQRLLDEIDVEAEELELVP